MTQPSSPSTTPLTSPAAQLPPDASGLPAEEAVPRPGGRTSRVDPAVEHFRHSYSKDKAQLIRRLSRIEGQVRGIARMIEREEYCIDILQQTSALRAAVDALALLVLEDHVQGCVRTAAEQGEAETYVEEVLDVVRRTLGRPIRGSSRSG
jgi:CsoR family transcriptional regulator, copper-sensing transcriptional repressor